ncbi:MAG: hypothetical protein JWR69_4046, partial [Pedosphaera sp.]|nr:hypothetical protein [Pedosphaera sp.]
QASPDATNWTSIYTNSTGASMTFTDEDSVSFTARYYRAVIANLQLALTSCAWDSNGYCCVHTESLPDAPYIIQASADLLNWIPIYTNQLGGPLDFWDLDAPAFPNRFYRDLIQTIGIRGYH